MIPKPLTLLALCAVAVYRSSAGGVTSSSSKTDSATSTHTAPSAAPILTACLYTCARNAQSPETCTKFDNTACVCTNQAYQQKVLACLNAKCTAWHLDVAVKFQEAACGNVTSGSNAVGTSFAPSSSRPASTSGAGGKNVLSAIVGIFGALVGFGVVF